MSWPKVKLSTISSLIMGQSPPSSTYNTDGEGELFLTAGDFGEIRPEITRYTTSPTKSAEVNDVLICVVGATAGKINLGANCCIGRSVAAIRPIESRLDQYYLYYFMLSWVERIRAAGRGSAQKIITRKMVEELQIPLPPLDEQKRIAAILDKADELKSNSEQSKFIRQSLIRSIFVDMFEMGIGNETHLPLEQICKIVDCPHSTPLYSDDPTGYYCVRSQDLTDDGELIFDKMMQVTRDTFENRISRHTPKAGDILFLREGSIGRCAIIPNDVEICLGQRIMILGPDKNIINPTFLHYLILSDRFQHSLSRFKLGTTAGRVNIKDLRGLLIPIPELSKQIQFEKFANLLNEVPYEEELFSILSKSITQGMLT